MKEKEKKREGERMKERERNGVKGRTERGSEREDKELGVNLVKIVHLRSLINVYAFLQVVVFLNINSSFNACVQFILTPPVLTRLPLNSFFYLCFLL